MRNMISRGPCGGWWATCARVFPSAPGSPSPITAAPTPPGRSRPTGPRAAGGAGGPRRAARPRPGAAGHLVASEAEVLAYMDVDLLTDLNALLPLVAPLLSGHSDLAIGTRLARGSRVIRGPKRELISRGYNLLLRTLMGAVSPTRNAASRRSGATRRGYCCRSPGTPAGSSTPNCSCWPNGPGCASTRSRWTGSTTWTRASTSSAPPWPTCAAWPGSASASRAGPSRSRGCAGPPGAAAKPLPLQIARFTVIGVASTVAYVVLFLLLRMIMPAQAANVVSLLTDRGGQHRGEPAADVRHQRARGRGLAPGQGPDRSRDRAGPDLRGAGGARAGPPGRLAEVSVLSRPTWWPPSSGSCCSGTGCSAAPKRRAVMPAASAATAGQ